MSDGGERMGALFAGDSVSLLISPNLNQPTNQNTEPGEES